MTIEEYLRADSRELNLIGVELLNQKYGDNLDEKIQIMNMCQYEYWENWTLPWGWKGEYTHHNKQIKLV